MSGSPGGFALPIRKKLPHDIPSWVADGSRYFITINCARRGGDDLVADGRGLKLLESIAAYEALQKWYMHAMVVMPDHVHMIATFHRIPGIQATIKAWKSFHARGGGLSWQSGFFEHRLRNDAEFSEKLSYTLLNPVRKGLVVDWKDWSFTFVRGSW